MTDKIESGAGKKRKLPSSDSAASAANKTMGQTMENGNRSCADACSIVDEISYVEFYSGVGGWTMALEEALNKLGPLMSSIRTKKPTNTRNNNASHRYQLKRLAALDHSDLCVKVFSHNFAKSERDLGASSSETNTKPNKKRKPKSSLKGPKSYSIERMPLRQLEEWSADVWVMSPPCQPHTRQHNENNHQLDPQQKKKDLEDPRSKSFLKICEWLAGDGSDDTSRLSDQSLPSLIFLENVVGFESSNSFGRWRSALQSREYRVGHFHLTPTQVGLPNDRPRFYTVAIRDADCGFDNSSSVLPPPMENIAPPSASSLLSYLPQETKENDHAPRIWKSIPELHVTPDDKATEIEDGRQAISPISFFLDRSNSNTNATAATLQVPEKVLKNQSAWCFDIVLPSDRRSSCFTHSYGRFIRGTGSILYDDETVTNDGTKSSQNGVIQLLPPEEREFQANWMEQLDTTKLRYFSGDELARLFGFSQTFSFPSDTSLKQQWKLMGNSLNVRVASKLIELGFLLRYYFYVEEFDTSKKSS